MRYYNTVGSKEGWTPASFVSSRANRVKDAPKLKDQRPEDFMDDEDRADAEEARKVQTADGFAGLGTTQDEITRRGDVLDLFTAAEDKMGVRLLKKMGWREGQGVGPKVRRRARLDVTQSTTADGVMHLFAPEDTSMINFIRKKDHKGVGFEGQQKLAKAHTSTDKATSTNSDEEADEFGAVAISRAKKANAKKKPTRGGMGIGILNDTGSDDEDPYEIGPRISYSRVIGGDKKKRKPGAIGKASGSMNPILAAKPIFISKKAAAARTSAGFRKCHDGRLPLGGFVLGTNAGALSSVANSDGKYSPPVIPVDWKSSKEPTLKRDTTTYSSSADAAKASKHDPRSRASMLGEAALPGKSVFDFLSTAARDRLASASGKTNLPEALGEVPKGYAMTPEEKARELASIIPMIEKDVAIAALTRGASGFMPYAEDPTKRDRYRSFLEFRAGIRDGMPERTVNVSKDDWLKELQEFANCAQIFKPMSGMMATRFTSSSTAPKMASDASESSASHSLLSKPAVKPEDSAEAAAKVGMFGPMTRSVQQFYPSRLLCKRFNVKPPAHVLVGQDQAAGDTADGGGGYASDAAYTRGPPARDLDLVSTSSIKDMLAEAGMAVPLNDAAPPKGQVGTDEVEPVVDVERNDALEGRRAGDAVFKAIFGDSSDDDDDDDNDG